MVAVPRTLIGSHAMLTLTGDAPRLTGLVLDAWSGGVNVASGTGAVIEDNVFGADPTGKVAGALGVGVWVAKEATGAVIRDNLFASGYGTFNLGSSTQMSGNTIGMTAAGVALGDGELGIGSYGPSASITDNTIRATEVGLDVGTAFGSDAGGSVVDGNRVGVDPTGSTPFADQGQGIRIDGAADTAVTDNVVVAGPGVGLVAGGNNAGISVTGRSELTDDGTNLHPLNYLDSTRSTAGVTGGKVTVSGNRVGGGTPAADGVVRSVRTGIIVWADADNVTITDNTVAGQDESGIELHGGTGHRVTGNRVGFTSSGAELASKVGIFASDTPGIALGADGAGNQILATDAGVLVGGAFADSTISDNVLTTDGSNGNSKGIAVVTDPGTLTITANDVTGFHRGVVVVSGSSVIDSNAVRDGDIGLEVAAPGAVITGNTVTGTRDVAIRSFGDTSDIEDNLVGRESRSGPTIGNAGEGVVVGAGPATVKNNVVAGSGQDGITVTPDAKALLRGNVVASTTGTPIVAPGGPPAPSINAAIRTSGPDEEDRTVLVVTGLPADGSGTVEVFANDSCDDAEAQYAPRVTLANKPGHGYLLVPLVGRGDVDSFTVTYTDGTQSTSSLSNCEARGTYPDSDGDGSVDPIEQLAGTGDDGAHATVVTDTGNLLEVGTDHGTLRNVAIVDDPAPGTHPSGFSLPYGALSFAVEGLALGGSVQVTVGVIDGAVTAGDSYWKYGPPSAGAAAVWYRFDPDEASGTGAVLTTLDLGDAGFVRSWVLSLTDGARGDTDGFVDGRIVDPGGPALTADPAPAGEVAGPARQIPCDPALLASAGFDDVTTENVHAHDIDCLVSLGIAHGTSDGHYSPRRPVTRAQAASFVTRLADLVGAALPSAAPDAFDDDSAPHATAIDRLAAAGILRGVGDRRFAPNDPVTRAQMASILYRAWPLLTGHDLPDGPDVFGDDGRSVHRMAIDALAAAGVIEGVRSGVFDPHGLTTRDQMASLLTRVVRPLLEASSAR